MTPTSAGQPSPAEYAERAAEAVRGLNHATIRPGGYVWPSDVNDVVRELQRAATGMGQALEQARTWLARAHARGLVGHDQAADVDAAVWDAGNALSDAARGARWLGEDLARATAITTHLTGTRYGEDDR